MRRFSPAFSAMISVATLLTGCFEDDRIVLPEPPVEQGPRLEEGGYEVQIAAVDVVDCYGMRARDLVGESLRVELSHRSGDRVVVAWDGLRLKGEMAGGALSASGEQSAWYDTGDTTVAEEPPAEPDGDETADSGDSSGPSSGDSGGSADPGGGESDPDTGSGGGSDPGAPDGGDSGDSTDPDTGSGGGGGSGGSGGAPDMWLSLSLDLQIRAERIADGRFHYVMESGGERCEIDAQVGMIFAGGRGREPQPVYEDTETDTDVDTEADAG